MGLILSFLAGFQWRSKPSCQSEMVFALYVEQREDRGLSRVLVLLEALGEWHMFVAVPPKSGFISDVNDEW